jgi:hypothetical protein
MIKDLGFVGRTLLKRIRKSFNLPEHARIANANIAIGVNDAVILSVDFIVTQKMLDDLADMDEQEHTPD